MKSEITLPVSDLKAALHGFNKIIGRKTTLPVLNCVKLSRQNGVVTLEATDLDSFVTYTINGNQPDAPMAVVLPLEQLAKAFKCSGSKQDVVIVCDGKSTKLRYAIAGTFVEQPANTLPMDEWPVTPKITVESTRLEPGFGLALKQALASCSEDPSRHVLRGACLDVREKAHYIIGTNGRMLYSANSFTFPLKDSVIIPDSKFITGSGLLDGDDCFLAVQPSKKPSDIRHLCLHNLHWRLVTREIDGKYPNWKQVLPPVDTKWTKVKLQPSAIEQLSQVIPNLPGRDGDNNVVRLRIEKVLWIEGRNKDDADWTTIAVPDVEVTGKTQAISLNRDYLLNALKFGLDELAVQDELTPLVARKDGKRIVIMPVRPPAVTTTKPAQAPNTSTATPPAVENKTEAEERTAPMTVAPMTPPERGNLKTATTDASPTKEALEKVETIRIQLRDLLADLTDLTGLLRTAEKEKRSTEKEVANVRQTIRSLQGVRI